MVSPWPRHFLAENSAKTPAFRRPSLGLALLFVCVDKDHGGGRILRAPGPNEGPWDKEKAEAWGRYAQIKHGAEDGGPPAGAGELPRPGDGHRPKIMIRGIGPHIRLGIRRGRD